MKTRKIESFNYRAEVPFQGTDPNKNPKTPEIWKVVLSTSLSRSSPQEWDLPCCSPAPWTPASSPDRHPSAKIFSGKPQSKIFVSFNWYEPRKEQPDFKIHQSINAPRKEEENWTRNEFQQPGHSAGIFSGAGCSQHRPEPAATGSATDSNLLNPVSKIYYCHNCGLKPRLF